VCVSFILVSPPSPPPRILILWAVSLSSSPPILLSSSSRECQVSNWKGGEGRVGHKFSCAGKSFVMTQSLAPILFVVYDVLSD
jgi:hypothetical protein